MKEEKKTPLNVGILVDSLELAQWQMEMLLSIQQNKYAKITGIILKKKKPLVHTSIWKRWKRSYKYLFFILLQKWENLLHDSPFLQNVAIDNQLGELKIWEFSAIETRVSDRYAAENVEFIKSQQFDVLIRLGGKILRGDILNAAKYGVWSYHSADNRLNRGIPDMLWEVFLQAPFVGMTLQQLNEDLDGGKVLARAFYATDDFSYIRNRGLYYSRISDFLPRKLAELAQKGATLFYEEIDKQNADFSFYAHKLYSFPKNKEVVYFYAKLLVKKIQQKWTNVGYFEEWILMFSFQKTAKIAQTLYHFRPIFSPQDRYWADPKVIYEQGKYYIFLEEFIYTHKKGHIAVMEIAENGDYTLPIPIVQEAYHLSYPCIFTYKNGYYMIPESQQNRTIDLYRCIDFPLKWEKVHTLIQNIEAIDSTLLEWEGKYWLFMYIPKQKDIYLHDELYIYYAEDLFAETWTPHLQNPVITDARKARPAGSFVVHNGQLYRPSQNCTPRYGYEVVWNKVLTLNTEKYEESYESCISPDWNEKVKGVHTFSHAQNLTLIDAIWKQRK